MKSILRATESIFDTISHYWESPPAHRLWGSFLVGFFLFSYFVVELNQWHLLPAFMDGYVPHSRLAIIELAFTLVLVIEVVSMIFSLAHSVASSVGKQFEVLSLIFLRDIFKEFSHLHEPLHWEEIASTMPAILITGISALAIFMILGYYYRIQRHIPLTTDAMERRSFVQAKKLVALLLMISFVALMGIDLYKYFQKIELRTSPFEPFYTLIVFSDVLIVLISLRYGSRYHVAFRNSGFAVATVLIRLSLMAPPMTGAMLGVVAALFALGVTMAYNAYHVPTFPDVNSKSVDYL